MAQHKRDSRLIERRNAKIAARYYYWTEEMRMRIEELLGVDLPDDVVNKVIEGVKAKISLDKVGDALNMLGGLFGKK